MESVTDSVEPEVINPALPVYGSIPTLRIAPVSPLLSTFRQMIAVKKKETSAFINDFASH